MRIHAHARMGSLRHLDPKTIPICADAPIWLRVVRGTALPNSSSGREATTAEELSGCPRRGQGFGITSFGPCHLTRPALALRGGNGSCPQGSFLSLEVMMTSKKVFFHWGNSQNIVLSGEFKRYSTFLKGVYLGWGISVVKNTKIYAV